MNLDLYLIGAIVCIGTAIIGLMFDNVFPGWDTRFLHAFSRVATTPKWFVLWFLVFIGWLPMREVLVRHNLWFRTDGDVLVMAFLWSVVPFMVENAMKYSTAEQMKLLEENSKTITAQNVRITELTIAIRAALDHSHEQGDLIITLVRRLLEVLEEDAAADGQ